MSSSQKKIKSSSVMIDLETEDLLPTSQIKAIAAVVFDREGPTDSPFCENVSPTGQAEMGFTMGNSTQAFWKKPQNAEALESLSQNQIELKDALKKLSSFIRSYNITAFWANSPTFDCVILENAYRACGISEEIPWKFYQWKDVRTVKSYFGSDKTRDELEQIDEIRKRKIVEKHKIAIVDHNPLYDCYKQIMIVHDFEAEWGLKKNCTVAAFGKKARIEIEMGSIVVRSIEK